MQHQTDVLSELADELFTVGERVVLERVRLSQPLDTASLVEFDLSLGGPSACTIAGPGPGPGTLNLPGGHGVGRYEIDDRDVFRPLQYCVVYLTDMDQNIEWVARAIVEMSSAHVESLVKRIGGWRFLPLGAALRKASVLKKVDPVTWGQIERFTPIYNEAKHRFDHEIGTHMFSMGEAVLAYFVCRRLGQRLYRSLISRQMCASSIRRQSGATR